MADSPVQRHMFAACRGKDWHIWSKAADPSVGPSCLSSGCVSDRPLCVNIILINDSEDFDKGFFLACVEGKVYTTRNSN